MVQVLHAKGVLSSLFRLSHVGVPVQPVERYEER